MKKEERKVDNLGRFVIPKKMRDDMCINSGDKLDILMDEDSLIVTKKKKACALCGNQKKLKEVRGEKFICTECIKEII